MVDQTLPQQESFGQPVVSWRSKGTADFSGWILGERVTAIKDLKEGEVYLQDSPNFDALNMVKILRVDLSIQDHPMAYASFVKPSDTTLPRMNGDGEFAIHAWVAADGDIYRVKRAG